MQTFHCPLAFYHVSFTFFIRISNAANKFNKKAVLTANTDDICRRVVVR